MRPTVMRPTVMRPTVIGPTVTGIEPCTAISVCRWGLLSLRTLHRDVIAVLLRPTPDLMPLT